MTPAARRGRVAWWLAAPMLVMGAITLLLPFVWRSAAALWSCAQDGGCEALRGAYYTEALLNTVLVALGSTLLALPPALGACVAAVRRPRWARTLALLSSLGANFAGVPLALSFTLMFGVQGFFTQVLGFVPLQLEGSSGLFLAYLCFQVPLAALLLLAPGQLLDAQWQEAAATLGAGAGRYWRCVGLPVLAPSLVEVGVLLFANAAAAYATPFALAGSSANMLAVRLASLVSGDLFADARLPALLALELFLLLTLTLLAGRATARWLAGRVH